MEAFRTAHVYVRNIFAGELSETDEGYSFAYDKAYLADENASAVSLTLPLEEKIYTSKTLFSFFDGLIRAGFLTLSAGTGKLTARTDLDFCL